MAQLGYWVADWNLSEGAAILALGGDHDYMVDTIAADAKPDLAFLTRSNIRKIAVYVTGPPNIIWTAGEIAAYRLAGFTVVTIDQRDGPAVLANVGDVESGAKTPAQAIAEAEHLLDQGKDYTIYVSVANLAALEAEWAKTGRPPGRKVAFQWASPSSNPDTIVAGHVTVKAANVDLSVTLTDWHPIPPAPAPPRPSSPTDRAIVTLNGASAAVVDFDPAVKGWGVAKLTGPASDHWAIVPTTPGVGRA